MFCTLSDVYEEVCTVPSHPLVFIDHLLGCDDIEGIETIRSTIMMIYALLLAAMTIHLCVVYQRPEPKKARISDLELLNWRYDAGEISAQEYLVLLQSLR